MDDSTPTDPFEELERAFDLVSEQFGTERTGVPVDVLDTGEEIVVRADLPGRSSDAIDVTLEDDTLLTISAADDEPDRDGRYVKRERPRQAARRTVRLPEAVAPEATTASYDDGVLTVELGKQSSDGGTSITVE
ncbi:MULTISPECIES: Hsp20/alpha crystallin family protein [Halomicrobium]|uniref:Heat shock protein Hsp20 n=2 Tax=Halomicrobium mukohataei TaxID=57705 RepID=C7P1A3_HALMD|nr:MULTISPECIES: Hsp20/alpha crystallin family protein [Halomicrobium]ACV47111.1 heat shock protein Hsp20 [Halomicrobium mukohataei DSM 12286]QCD65593.1 Hsp20/alpha crystallin family protein [Halomicrobium mukohataei]QFR20399.1 Hsp20 family protein [Halomicrobium sp. ZPS1]